MLYKQEEYGKILEADINIKKPMKKMYFIAWSFH